MIKELILSMRPNQWIKNLFIFAALVFSGNLFNLRMFLVTAGGFLLFCGLSGCVYIINDIVDIEKDKRHPQKSKRPLASGKLGVKEAAIFCTLFVPILIFLSFLLGRWFGLVAASYFSLILLYNLFIQYFVIIDVMAVSLGFVLRVVAGAVAIDVEISPWLLICMTLLALFLALGKRRHELILLRVKAKEHRRVLAEYSPRLLDEMIAVVNASTLVAYTLYTISERTVKMLGTRNLIFTAPFVLYGIFRYLYLIHRKGEGGSPDEILLKDKPLICDIILWVIAVVIILYLARR